MGQKEEIHEIEIDFKGKPLKTHYFVTGKTHRISIKVPVLLLNHHYHDDVPVSGAEFEVELEDGTTLRGHLDEFGQAEVRGMRSRPMRVRYGLDPKPYEIADVGTNPAYIAHFTKLTANALASPGAARKAEPPDAIAFGVEAVDWIWGTVKGGFNTKQTVSQIIVDALIGMIPLVGDITAVRDLLALMLGMAQDPKRRESKLEWMALVVLLFALVPVIGGVIKGVGKLLLRGGKEAAEASTHLKEMVAVLNRLGMGDSLKWIKELDLEGYTNEILGRWSEVTHRLDMILDSIQLKLKDILSPTLRSHLSKIRGQIRDLSVKGESMIPEALRDLSERLKAAQRKMYQGEWHEIPKDLASRTWETEARLVDVPGGKKWVVEKMPFPPNGPEVFTKRPGWPDLADEANENFVKNINTKELIYRVIPCFSGKMRPVFLPKGTLIYRVISDSGNPAGSWWVYALPESGKEWREELAVLDSFSGNGYFVEMTVPEEGLYVWEGKAASQVENSPKAASTLGQFLPGGQTQLFIDFKHRNNAMALNRISKPVETQWIDHLGLHIPPREAQAEFLNAFEFAQKTRIRTTTTEKLGRKHESDSTKK